MCFTPVAWDDSKAEQQALFIPITRLGPRVQRVAKKNETDTVCAISLKRLAATQVWLRFTRVARISFVLQIGRTFYPGKPGLLLVAADGNSRRFFFQQFLALNSLRGVGDVVRQSSGCPTAPRKGWHVRTRHLSPTPMGVVLTQLPRVFTSRFLRYGARGWSRWTRTQWQRHPDLTTTSPRHSRTVKNYPNPGYP